MKRTRPRSASLPSILPPNPQDPQKLEVVHEETHFLVTHYVPKSVMDAELRVRMHQLYEDSQHYDNTTATTATAAASLRVQRLLCAVCADCCSDCAENGIEWRKRQLATDARYLFDAFLEPIEGTAKWRDVQLELMRHERGALVLVSTCRQHTLELWMFHNMESACLGFVYRGPTDFNEKCSASLCVV